jgi:hypothetical protein
MHLSEYTKAIVSAVMAVLTLLTTWLGWHLDWLTEDWILTIIAVLSPILVLIFPNSSSDT